MDGWLCLSFLLLQGLGRVSGREMVHLVLKVKVGCVVLVFGGWVVGPFTAKAREKRKEFV